MCGGTPETVWECSYTVEVWRKRRCEKGKKECVFWNLEQLNMCTWKGVTLPNADTRHRHQHSTPTLDTSNRSLTDHHRKSWRRWWKADLTNEREVEVETKCIILFYVNLYISIFLKKFAMDRRGRTRASWSWALADIYLESEVNERDIFRMGGVMPGFQQIICIEREGTWWARKS